MKRTYNSLQKTYMLAKASLEELEEREREVDSKYIQDNHIVNPDGSIPRASWAIDIDEIADKAIDDCSKIVIESGLWDKILYARNLLKEAEENLIQYGISLMPNSKDKTTLKEAVSKDYNVRQKVIDLTLRLDTRTVRV